MPFKQLAVTFVSLLFLSSAQAQELARTGKFYADSVSVKSGEVWLGLYQVGDEYELRNSTLVVNGGVTVMGLAGKEVKTDQPTEPLFLVRGLEALQPGKVDAVIHDWKFLYPGQMDSFVFGDSSKDEAYNMLAATGEVLYPNTETSIRKYKLFLSNQRRRQILLDFEVGLDNARPGVIWAGDLDRDGKADFYMGTSRHYDGYIDFALFLSSAAKDEEIVGQVATWGASID